MTSGLVNDLGPLSVKNYKSHVGRNTTTKKEIGVKPNRIVFFKAGEELKERVDL
jgi:integration host factor subunit beta